MLGMLVNVSEVWVTLNSGVGSGVSDLHSELVGVNVEVIAEGSCGRESEPVRLGHLPGIGRLNFLY